MENEKAKNAVDKYYEFVAKCDKMAVADALEELKSVAEDLVDVLTDIIYYE